MEKLNALFTQWKALQPLSERKKHLLRQRFMVEYNYNSNHIEGNTLTYGQTELLLLFGKVSGEGDLKDFVDMQASQVSVRMMEEAVREGGLLTQNLIRQLHHTLLREDYTVYRPMPDGTPTSYTIHAGQYKTRPNSVITRYGERFDYASPEETPAMMADLVDWYNAMEQSGELSPAVLATLFHYRYIRIHPFEDGNGRMARLLVNYILARHGWPMVVVRHRDKNAYLDALHATDVAVGAAPSEGAYARVEHIGPFLRYFTQMISEELHYNIAFARETSPSVWWYDGRRIKFRSPASSIILTTLQQYPDSSVAHLAKVAGISPSAVSAQLHTLSKHHYIYRQEDAWVVLATASV